jgi:hypothetical protein
MMIFLVFSTNLLDIQWHAFIMLVGKKFTDEGPRGLNLESDLKAN